MKTLVRTMFLAVSVMLMLANAAAAFDSSNGAYLRTGTFAHITGQFNAGVGDLLGGNHDTVEGMDLSRPGDAEFTVHRALSCGNEDQMGTTARVPEPATMLLFGCGLVGMAVFGRKKISKNLI